LFVKPGIDGCPFNAVFPELPGRGKKKADVVKYSKGVFDHLGLLI
jgi:hypothetical protein